MYHNSMLTVLVLFVTSGLSALYTKLVRSPIKKKYIYIVQQYKVRILTWVNDLQISNTSISSILRGNEQRISTSLYVLFILAM